MRGGGCCDCRRFVPLRRHMSSTTLEQRAAAVKARSEPTPLRKADPARESVSSDAADAPGPAAAADGSRLPTLLGQDIRQLVRHHQSGGNLNEFGRDGSTPLQRACEGGHLESVLYLLQNGVEARRASRDATRRAATRARAAARWSAGVGG